MLQHTFANNFLVQLLPAFQIDDERTTKFLASIPEKMAQPPWNYSGTMDKNLTVSLSPGVALSVSVSVSLLYQGNVWLI